MNRRSWLFVFAMPAAIAACGGSVVVEPTGGAGGASSSSATSTSVSSGSSVVTTGTSTSTGAGGSVNACLPGQETMGIRLTTASGEVLGCTSDFPGQNQGDLVLEGIMAQVAEGEFTLDSCPPNADCPPIISKLSIKWQNQIVWIPNGAFVRLHMYVEAPMGCGAKILITNLPSWGGTPNPVAPQEMLWFAASDGLDKSFPEAPFGLEKVLHDCPANTESPLDIYDFRFFDPADPKNEVIVSQGGTEMLWPSKSPGAWTVHNMRAFDPYAADDYWNWGYWIAQTPTLD